MNRPGSIKNVVRRANSQLCRRPSDVCPSWPIVSMAFFRIFKRKEKPVFIPKIPERPAHEIALEGLHRIESEKLWQQGFTKKYYSELTEIIRQYIERRFSINAMEQTTDEILLHFDATLIAADIKEKLGFILRQADMVKFAKALPFPIENENSMAFAYEFIHVTRPVLKADLEKKEVTS